MPPDTPPLRASAQRHKTREAVQPFDTPGHAFGSGHWYSWTTWLTYERSHRCTVFSGIPGTRATLV
ncbi:hypothetical protein KSX_74000 [Ktedonospora formicarum]|uniref:Uncharacterized protein n=1 Tax=Ktedonospora formicarum TaxID=2778364 RepID=A0A8J3IAU9_9CHLR|nr:hypothetical protein KSX_74000 [Ktedonospora formicarum]